MNDAGAGMAMKEDLEHTRAALAMCENIDFNVGRVLKHLDDRKLADNTIVLYFCDNGPNGAIWALGWVGGDVVNSVSRTATAYVHRGSTILYRPTTVWPNDAPASVSDGLNAWTDQIIATLDPHTPQESYQNFPNRSLQNWQQQYYAENFERLVDIKTKYDPGNLFNNAQSIPPRS
mgnify:CR=1 FL=1